MVWANLKVRHCFQRQSFTKYFRQIEMGNSTLRKSSIYNFRQIFVGKDKKFVSEGGPSTRQ